MKVRIFFSREQNFYDMILKHLTACSLVDIISVGPEISCSPSSTTNDAINLKIKCHKNLQIRVKK